MIRGDLATADRLVAEGNRAEDGGAIAEACGHYRAAVAAAPKYAKAHLNLGIGLEAAGDAAGAEQAYQAALELDPRNAFAHYNLGKLLFIRGDSVRAGPALRAALEHRPDFPEAYAMLGNLHAASGGFAAAAQALEAALRLRPGYAIALRTYASVLEKLDRQADVEAALRAGIGADPKNLDALTLLGSLLARQGRLEEAASSYQQALALSPRNPDVLSDLGNVLAMQGRPAEAAAAHRAAIELRPDLAEAHCNLGNVLMDEGNVEEASACFRKALALEPGFAKGHLCLASLLSNEQRFDEAIVSLRAALQLDPALANAHLILGNIHADRDVHAEALASYQKAVALDPQDVQARWSLAMSQLPAVPETEREAAQSRAAFSEHLATLAAWIDEERGPRSVAVVGSRTPFYLAYQEESNRELLASYGMLCTRIMSGWLERERRPPQGTRRRAERIRVGVVSRHFQNHSVWNAIVKGWFQKLDAGRFELEAFYLGEQEDQETRLAGSLAARFEKGRRTLRQWVDAIASRSPDVLLYPEVGMDTMTVKLASLRLAPVQAASWGHPDTTGLPTIDYFLSAEDLEPESAQQHYTERLVRLPRLGCHYEAIGVAPAEVDLVRLGLDPGEPLLVCPGTPYKYAPQHDWVFPAIARRLGACRFVFFRRAPTEVADKLHRRLSEAFRREGLDARRFISFIPWQNTAQFHGLMRRSKVFLDTIGFSGFNTAIQAIECGLPIVTREGRFMRGRLASGILRRMGLPELIAGSADEYVELAVGLASDEERRSRVLQRIVASRHVLFGDPASVRSLEEFLASVA